MEFTRSSKGEWNLCRKAARFMASVAVVQMMVFLIWSVYFTSTPSMLRIPTNVSEWIDSDVDNVSLLTPNETKKTTSNSTFAKDLDSLLGMKDENKMLSVFLESYRTYCETRTSVLQPRDHTLPLCSCIPSQLVGRQNVMKNLPSNPDPAKIESAHPEVTPGGHWGPQDCQPRQKIAIIIPYRSRTTQLYTLLHHLVPFLQRQLMDFSIFVAEQGEPEVFNKNSVMNAGFLAASKNESFDCYLFHDVDTLPEDDRNFYTCTDNPRQLAWYVDRYKYRPYYWRFVGGGTAFTAEQLKRMNGFSNKFYGWGGEDDDSYYRIIYSGMRVARFPVAVARYSTLKHAPDTGNPLNVNKDKFIAQTAKDKKGAGRKNDGLNTLKHTVRSIEHKPLFTRILIDLPPPPSDSKFKSRGHKPATKVKQKKI